MDHEKNFLDEFEFEKVEADDDEEVEALSLSDLPLFHQWGKDEKDNNNKNNNSPPPLPPPPDEFDFCSFSKESEMCAADEVFFRGQILPLRHSVSSEKGLSTSQQYDGRRHRSYSISRSDSMDHYYSSRSSSMSSRSGSGSGTGSRSSSSTTVKYNPKLPPRNQFHSHPSPSPRLQVPGSRHGCPAGNPIKKSSVWNVLRLGLVATPPELSFQDLKPRSNKHFGSRNSTGSNSSDGAAKKKKMRPRVLGGCKCAADAVDTVVIIRRSASEESESDVVAMVSNPAEEIKRPEKLTKKHLSHHRTFEWLKQLSVEGAAADGAA